MKRVLYLFLLFVILINATSGLSMVYAADTQKFTYKHDPMENETVRTDAIEDENAIYGFRPSSTGSLKMYADADWSDPETVEKGRQDRIAYHKSVELMYKMLEEMKAENKTVEEIARALSAERNRIRLDAYKNDPEELEQLKQRNLEKYGHEEGPLPDELYEQYGSWSTVAAKSFSINAAMDACLGLYDDYYEVYQMVNTLDGYNPKTGDANTVVYVIMMSVSAVCFCSLILSKKRFSHT